MSTLKFLTDAFGLNEITPVAKLIYIRFSMEAGQDGRGEVYLSDLLEFACCTNAQARAGTLELAISGLVATTFRQSGDDHIVVYALGEEDIIEAKGGLIRIDPRRARIFTKTEGRCFYCIEAPAEQLDHMHPSSRGGSDADENMIGACTKCNGQKKDRTVDEYRALLSYQRKSSLAEVRFYGEGPAPAATEVSPLMNQKREGA